MNKEQSMIEFKKNNQRILYLGIGGALGTLMGWSGPLFAPVGVLISTITIALGLIFISKEK